MARARQALLGLTIAGAAACSSPPAAEIAMDFARADFYDAPFPSDDLRAADGHVDISRLPDPDHPVLMEQARALLAATNDGFARTGAIYFRATGALDPASLPDLAGSIADDAAVYVVPLDSRLALRKQPIDVAFLADGGPYGAKQLLALLPLQGAPLVASTRYAAVVTTRVRAADGRALAPSPTMIALAEGHLAGPYHDAVATLVDAGVDPKTLAALAVFTTGDPTAGLAAGRAALPAPLVVAPPTFVRAFADYCVYASTVQMPVLQIGTPPYTSDGGTWADPPAVDHVETARVVITIPHAAMPALGWPTVVFVRTGGGGDDPLVDRGACATPDFTTPITPGSGPARELARVGFAGVQVDGPLGGPNRNPTGADEEFLIFNVQNAGALRDNIRQSAVELAWLPDALAALAIDTTACTGAPASSTIDLGHLALMGHSMGAWIAPLVAQLEPRYGALVLSGAGGSFITNIVDKQKPIAPVAVVSGLLGLHGYSDNPPSYHDPALTIVQWAAEPADPQSYFAPNAHALMLQGIVDHYILPSIANATSLSEALDAAGPLYDATNAELQSLGQPSLAAMQALVGRQQLALPAQGNDSGTLTRVVVQHPGDAIEDGHEVIFQTEAPKHQYRCFLASWLRGGAPIVPPDGAADDPCP